MRNSFLLAIQKFLPLQHIVSLFLVELVGGGIEDTSGEVNKYLRDWFDSGVTSANGWTTVAAALTKISSRHLRSLKFLRIRPHHQNIQVLRSVPPSWLTLAS